MGLYLKNGYLDYNFITRQGMPFNLITGGRGTGKTFGALEYAIRHNIHFMLMRRTLSQMEMISNPDFSPFNALNREFAWHYTTVKNTKYTGAVYNAVPEDDGKLTPAGAPIGYTCALSTIQNIRGFDGSDIDWLIYDEFIPERHAKPIRAEGEAFLNAYETINRNRELQGRSPLVVMALSNSNDLDNAIYRTLDLVGKAEKMQRNAQEYSVMADRGVLMANLFDSPISEQKQETAIYRLTRNTSYADMALKNSYSEIDETRIGQKINLSAYVPMLGVGDLTVYVHKSNGRVYVSTHRRGTVTIYGTTDTELTRLRTLNRWLLYKIVDGVVDYDSTATEIALKNYLHL